MEFIIPQIATLTNLGKGLGFGLSLGFAAFGAALGIGLIFMSVINSTARQPEAKKDLQPDVGGFRRHGGGRVLRAPGWTHGALPDVSRRRPARPRGGPSST